MTPLKFVFSLINWTGKREDQPAGLVFELGMCVYDLSVTSLGTTRFDDGCTISNPRICVTFNFSRFETRIRAIKFGSSLC